MIILVVWVWCLEKVLVKLEALDCPIEVFILLVFEILEQRFAAVKAKWYSGRIRFSHDFLVRSGADAVEIGADLLCSSKFVQEVAALLISLCEDGEISFLVAAGHFYDLVSVLIGDNPPI